MSRRLLPRPVTDLLAGLAHEGCEIDPARIAVLDDPAVVLALEHHHLAGLVYSWLDRSGLLTGLPAARVAPLKDFYLRQWLRMERLLLDLGELSDAFAARGVRVVLLKGVHISSRCYGDPYARAVADIDLLVRPNQRSAASAIAQECGFVRTSWMPFGANIAGRVIHYIDLVRDGIALDLHHAIRIHPALNIDAERLWSSTTVLDLGGRRYRVLDDEHLLLFQLLSIHFDFARGYVRQRALLDLLIMVCSADGRFDWPRFFDARRGDGTLRIAAEVLRLTLVVFGCADRYPELRRLLEDTAPMAGTVEERDRCEAFLRGAGRLDLVRWWARLFDWPPTLTLLWWTAGFPVRYASCKSNLVPRLVIRVFASAARRSPGSRPG